MTKPHFCQELGVQWQSRGSPGSPALTRVTSIHISLVQFASQHYKHSQRATRREVTAEGRMWNWAGAQAFQHSNAQASENRNINS